MNMKKLLALLLTMVLLIGLLCGCADSQADAEPEKEPAVDFIVDVESGRDPVILQFTDTQIIDAAQMRTFDRLGNKAAAYWATDKMEDRCFKYLRETVAAVKPDLILMTGDNVYGEFDDKGTSWQALIEVMESFGVPWAPVFGNHDPESKKGADWQCEQLEKAEHCLFKQRKLTGNGNYTVGIRQNDKITRVFFMIDTGSTSASAETLANGHTLNVSMVHQLQIDWFKETATRIREEINPDVKISFAFHIPLDIFEMPLVDYGYYEAVEKEPFKTILIDKHPDKKEGDFGIVNTALNGIDSSWELWDYLCEVGTDSIFVGHEHGINAGFTYKGVYIQFGHKSSTYAAANYLTKWGGYVCSYDDQGMPQVGGTVFTLYEADGTIQNLYNYLCKQE